MKRIRLIATGGTIACMPTEHGLAPGLDAHALLSYAGAGAEGVDCVDLFNMDSSNIQPEEWRKIAGKVLKSSWDYDGIVITHGTDTMAYTASMLSFMLRGISVPVVLTGSQYPIAYPDSDGRKNLANALLAARVFRAAYTSALGTPSSRDAVRSKRGRPRLMRLNPSIIHMSEWLRTDAAIRWLRRNRARGSLFLMRLTRAWH